MTEKSPSPKGMALYVRGISQSRHGSSVQFAKKCADHGLKWIAIGGPWHEDRKVDGKVKNKDRRINKPDTIKRYAEQLAKRGVVPHIWGFPWWSRIEKFVEAMEECSCSAIDGWLLDPELGMKGHPLEAAKLVHLCRAANPYRILGFTSYGLPRVHPNFPWEEFARPAGFYPLEECDYGSPQMYDVPKSRVVQGMAEYAELGFDALVPSFGLYKWIKRDREYKMNIRLPNGQINRRATPLSAQELNSHLLSFIDTPIPVQAMIGWSDNFCEGALWRVLSQWAERLERGACELPASNNI